MLMLMLVLDAVLMLILVPMAVLLVVRRSRGRSFRASRLMLTSQSWQLVLADGRACVEPSWHLPDPVT